MRLVERDYSILRETERWRICLARHIKVLAGFQGVRSCDRRLKKLIDMGYLERKKILYGLPSVYTLTHQGRALLGIKANPHKIRPERLAHDIAVLDTAVYFFRKHDLNSSDVLSERELHQADGFSVRKHQADFVFTKGGKTYAVEVELTLKAKDKIRKNIELNFLQYDQQIWVVPKSENRIQNVIKGQMDTYTNIITLTLEEVQSYVRSLTP